MLPSRSTIAQALRTIAILEHSQLQNMPHQLRSFKLPFRIPFFRIFYSTTYTITYIVTLGFLAFTPVSMIWQAVNQEVYQYTFVIGGTYVVVALLAIFIYTSRLYTNRSTLAGVGKAYVPVEDGEVGKQVRKMIVKQLERSAIIAWESRPRDLLGEVLLAEEHGIIPAETASLGRDDYLVGRLIALDPAKPPWGLVQHRGWSSPSCRDHGQLPNLQFDTVVSELPNLVEAKAVSLAPLDPSMIGPDGSPMADVAVVEVLRRPATMTLREYLTQLSYLGLVQPLATGPAFLLSYEQARFSGTPITELEFEDLMSKFADLLAGMTELSEPILEQIRIQTDDKESILNIDETPIQPAIYTEAQRFIADRSSLGSSTHSPVTARTRPSRDVTPYLQQNASSSESFSSVIHRTPEEAGRLLSRDHEPHESSDSSSLTRFSSEVGSVIRHSTSSMEHG